LAERLKKDSMSYLFVYFMTVNSIK